jgi:hypothetical protein
MRQSLLLAQDDAARLDILLTSMNQKLDQILAAHPPNEAPSSDAACVSLKAVGRMTSLSYTSLIRAIKDGRLLAHNIGRGRSRPTYRVRLADLQKFIEASRVHPPDSPTMPTTTVRKKSRHFD